MANLYGFRKPTARKLQHLADVQGLVGRTRRQVGFPGFPSEYAPAIGIGKVTAEIMAATPSGGTLTAGTGNVDIQIIDDQDDLTDALNDSSAAINVEVLNWSENSFAVDSYVPVFQNVWDGKLWILDTSASSASPASQIIGKCDTGQDLMPGVTTGKTFSKYTWNGTILTDTTENVTVVDPLNQNCILAGEYCWLQPQGGQYIPLGSNGLLRLAEVDSTINNTSNDTGQFWIGGAISTINVASAANAFVYNTYPGYNRPLYAGKNDRCWVWYDTTQSKWIAIPPPLALWTTGTIADALSPGGTTPAINSFAFRDWEKPSDKTDAAPTAGSGLANSYNHAAPTGEAVLMSRRGASTLGTWIVTDIEKQNQSLVRDLRLHTNDYVQSDLNTSAYVECVVATTGSWTDEILTEEC